MKIDIYVRVDVSEDEHGHTQLKLRMLSAPPTDHRGFRFMLASGDETISNLNIHVYGYWEDDSIALDENALSQAITRFVRQKISKKPNRRERVNGDAR